MPPRFEIVRETGSTNADLLARIRSGNAPPEGFWLIADAQVAGRGRQGRNWLDAPGNFMGSTVVHLGPDQPPPASLSFAAALALYETIIEVLGRPVGVTLKWPNDVLIGGAKFSGILLEREGAHAVIGIGVNLSAAPDIAGRSTRSLAQSGPAPDRDAFARVLALQMDRELARWREFGLAPLLERWLAAAHPAGAPLSVHDSSGVRLSGHFAGVTDDGALRLSLANGEVRVIHAGDVELEGN
ncbi:biotin--[acetyl-CoA-carboxylase] ligase [Altererythrobacter sp. B11]|uniref:biotin--[acetyl-CoA-carboxylase] ligase n=1 Tax=Altererythrobacter sp. B11 TaxID=2060312 RepID=UPI000DC73413|nr:biotin--[acetyl-CoA-carboxylase] ligase [Altererythrobacter sp. B11]BBC73018.1 biotin--[acetyl-CoA-carboxylase] ligase [Altererythrobacter sp. B11]